MDSNDRITPEECMRHVPNRFEMTLMAAVRAREISKGSEPSVPAGKNKPTVIAMREIASGRMGAPKPKISASPDAEPGITLPSS